jgi:hypothetical protein
LADAYALLSKRWRGGRFAPDWARRNGEFQWWQKRLQTFAAIIAMNLKSPFPLKLRRRFAALAKQSAARTAALRFVIAPGFRRTFGE